MGKSLESSLTHKAWGEDYHVQVKKGLLAKATFNNPESPSPFLLQLKGKRYVVAEEVSEIHPDTVKELMSNTVCKARDMGLGVETVVLSTLEIVSNFKTKAGMEAQLRWTAAWRGCARASSASRSRRRMTTTSSGASGGATKLRSRG